MDVTQHDTWGTLFYKWKKTGLPFFIKHFHDRYNLITRPNPQAIEDIMIWEENLTCKSMTWKLFHIHSVGKCKSSRNVLKIHFLVKPKHIYLSQDFGLFNYATFNVSNFQTNNNKIKRFDWNFWINKPAWGWDLSWSNLAPMILRIIFRQLFFVKFFSL